MKAVILALTIATIGSTASLNAQILGTRLPTPSTNGGTSVNGSWQVVGQDRNGNTIYERRTYDANGNIVVQRARRDANGNFSILDTRTVRENGNSRDCQVGSTGTVGDIILGRSGRTSCANGRGAGDGVWRQVGQGRNNNSVYERRTVDANGNVVIQRARRNSNGTFTILNTRTVGGNNGVRNRGRGDDDDQGENRGRGRGRKHGDGDEQYNTGNYGYNNGNYNSDNDYSGDDNRYKNSEQKSHGRGKGRKGRD